MTSARVLRLDGAQVVAAVEQLKVELLVGARGPQAQRVDGVHPVAGDRRVVRDPDHLGGGLPDHLEAAGAVVGDVQDLPPEADRHGVLGPRELPRVAELEPLVGALDLVPVADRLLEDAELVADAVAHRGQRQRGERLEETRRQAAEAAVAEPGVGLLLEQVGHADADLLEHAVVVLVDPERREVRLERAAEQVLRRQVVGPLDVALVVGPLRLDPALDQRVAHGEAERHEAIEQGRGQRVLGSRVAELVDEPATHERLAVERLSGQALLGVVSHRRRTYHGSRWGRFPGARAARADATRRRRPPRRAREARGGPR